METPHERAAWIDALIAGRQPQSETPNRPPVFSYDVARIECYQAFVHGLWTCAVLAAYASCEVFLAQQLWNSLQLKAMAGKAGDPAAALANSETAFAEVNSVRSVADFLKGLRAVGYYVPDSLAAEIIVLSDHKNDLAHVRKLYADGSLKYVATGATSVMGTMQPAPSLQEGTRRSYAQHAVETVVALWLAPVVHHPGPVPPGWVPPWLPEQ